MSNTINDTKLLAFIERVENVEEREKEEKEAKKDIYAEMKGEGYDIKIVKKIVKIRKMDRTKLQEENEVLETYANAIGLDY